MLPESRVKWGLVSVAPLPERLRGGTAAAAAGCPCPPSRSLVIFIVLAFSHIPSCISRSLVPTLCSSPLRSSLRASPRRRPPTAEQVSIHILFHHFSPPALLLCSPSSSPSTHQPSHSHLPMYPPPPLLILMAARVQNSKMLSPQTSYSQSTLWAKTAGGGKKWRWLAALAV